MSRRAVEPNESIPNSLEQSSSSSLAFDEAGLTLIELLTVVTIVGILAGLGVQSWTLYKERAYNTAALSDLRNNLVSLEAYMDDYEEYPECNGDACKTEITALTLSEGVYISFINTGGLSGSVIACYPNRGSLAYLRPSLTDITIEIPIGNCGQAAT